MKRILKIILLCSGCLISFSTTATAGKADVWADVDWSSLSITLGTGMTIDYSPADSYSRAAATNSAGSSDEIIDEQSGWVDTSAGLNFANAISSASTSSNLLTVTSYASESTAGAWAEASSEAWRDSYFSITGSGNVLIEIDYVLEIDLVADAGQDSYGLSSAWLRLLNGTTAVDIQVDDISENAITGTDTSLENLAGTFSIEIYFNDGDTGYFDTGIVTEARMDVVPEPISASLLLLGAGGLLLVRRRTLLGF